MSAGPDPRAFRRTAGLFATGVSVVAASGAGGLVGMTANAVCSVSLDPLLLLVCVGRTARLAAHLDTGTPFSVNILRSEQQVLSRYFAGGWRDLPRPEFHFEPWGPAHRLVGALAAIQCVIDRCLDGGDHWIVVGRVTDLYEGGPPADPLVFFAGRYRALAPAAPEVPPEVVGPDGVSVYYEEWSAAPPTRAAATEPAE